MIENIELGEGISFDATTNSGTGFVCRKHDELLTEPEVRSSLPVHHQQDEAAYNSPFHRAFWVNNRTDIPDLFNSVLESENGQDILNFDHLDDVSEAHYDAIFNGYSGAVLSALLVIPSGDLNALPETPSGCVSVGGQAIQPQPVNLEDWVDLCGVRFLEEIKFGRYFFLSARVGDLEATFNNEVEQGWADIVSILQVENYGNQLNSEARFNDIAIRYPNIEFFVTASDEFMSGGPNFPSFMNGSILDVEDIGDFISYYEAYAVSQVSAKNKGGLGVPIWQLAAAYNPTAYMEEICGIQMNNIDVAFGCLQNFDDQNRLYERRVLPQVGMYVDALANPTRYEQPNDGTDWQRFLDYTHDPLNAALPTMRAACESSLASADAATICAACDASAIEDAMADFASLTEPRLAPNGGHPLATGVAYEEFLQTGNESNTISRIEEKFCALRMISGKFAGGAESALLTRQSKFWDFTTSSNQSGSSNRLRAAITCTESITRGGLCGSQLCPWHETCVSSQCEKSIPYSNATLPFTLSVNNSSEQDLVIPPSPYPIKPYLAMFAGMKGKMAGLGEEAKVLQKPLAERAELHVKSQQGQFWGWAIGSLLTDDLTHKFFPINPDSQQGPSGIYDVSIDTTTAEPEQMVEFTLAPANQAFCYLMGAGGKFDGAGESVQVVRKSHTWVLQARSVGRHDQCPPCPHPGFACGCSNAKHLRVSARCVEFRQ